MKLFVFFPQEFNLDSWKCGYCRWEVTALYWLANSKQEAFNSIKKMINEDEETPLCGNCMADMLYENNYSIHQHNSCINHKSTHSTKHNSNKKKNKSKKKYNK